MLICHDDEPPDGRGRRHYFAHHIAAISSAIVLDDALTLVNHGSALHEQLTLSSLAPNTPAGSPGGRRA